jgi:hypothetical protein
MEDGPGADLGQGPRQGIPREAHAVAVLADPNPVRGGPTAAGKNNVNRDDTLDNTRRPGRSVTLNQ